MKDTDALLAGFHRTLVEEIRAQRPDYLSSPFTVAEIYQTLVPYGTHRDRIGVEMNADYEDALLRLLAGEGDYLSLDSGAALRGIREELESTNPNTGLYREYAAVDVRLNPDRLATGGEAAVEAVAISVEDLAPAPLAEPLAPEPAREEPAPTLELATPVPTFETPTTQDPVTESEGDSERCRWCRADLPSRGNLHYCPFCGMDVNLRPCQSCGEELEPGWRFCISCGSEVAT